MPLRAKGPAIYLAWAIRRHSAQVLGPPCLQSPKRGGRLSAGQKWVNEIKITPEPFCKRAQAALMYKQQGGNDG